MSARSSVVIIFVVALVGGLIATAVIVSWSSSPPSPLPGATVRAANRTRTPTFVRAVPRVFKGLAEPSGDHFREIVTAELAAVKALGVNTLSVYADYVFINGVMTLGTSSRGGSNQYVADAIDDYRRQIVEAKRKGFAVHLALSFGAGKNMRFGVPRARFLADAKREAVKWAAIAEEYRVETFAPASEIDYQIFREYFNEEWGNARAFAEAIRGANRFHDEVLPEIRKVFTGKTVYQSGLFSADNFSRGYDLHGTGLNHVGRELGDWREFVRSVYRDAETRARKARSGWMVTEAWFPFRAQGAGGKPGPTLRSPKGRSYDDLQDEFTLIALEEYQKFSGKIRPSGFFFTQYLMPAARVKGRPAENHLGAFFRAL